MSDPITFKASFPPIQSAVKRDGSGGGMRIQLDIPESEMGQAVMLLALMQSRLKITVEVEQDHPNGTGTSKWKKATRRVR